MKSDLENKIEHTKIKDNSLLIVKVGSEGIYFFTSRHVTPKEFKQAQETFKEFLGDKDLPVMIIHHNTDVQFYTYK